MISKKIKKINPSVTIEITTMAKKLKEEGKNVVILAPGEPDFPTPERIKKAAIKAIENNFTRYTAPDGILELKKAICKKLKRDNNLNYSLDEVIVTTGGKHALYLTFQCLLRSRDKVILPVPCWNSYKEQIKIAGGKVVPVMAKQDLSLNIKKIEEEAKNGAFILSINSPYNPTGHVMSEEEVKKIGQIAKKHKELFIISDEVYEYFVYEGKHINILSVFPELKERIIIINSLSKTYSMPGWRIGYAAGPRALIKAMKDYQGQMISHPCNISQVAATEALTGEQDDVRFMVKEFKKRRDFITDAINKLPLISAIPPKGAFYIFADISRTELTSLDFSKKLLEEELVAVIPGSAFGLDSHIRISFAAGMEDLKEGVKRLERFFSQLKI